MLSGLRINMHKSLLIGVGMDPGEVQHIGSALRCQTASLLMRYLTLQLEG